MKEQIIINDTDISEEEKDNIIKLLNKTQKSKLKTKNSIIAYYLLNNYIKENKLNIKLKDMKYTKNGKPYFDNNLYFSISHKDNITVLIINNSEVGIDIEKIKDYDKAILKYFFTEEEQEYIKTNKDFYEIYTLKESYIKMKDKKLLDIKLDDYKYLIHKSIIYKDYIISYVIQNKING